MSRIRDFFKKIKKLDNRGEAMILMIVAMGIIIFLGMSLLYATSTAFMIRNTERRSEQTFTSADTGMDLLKNRLTEVESKAAAKGYATTLNLYADAKSDQVNFRKSFIDGLLHLDVYSDGTVKVNDVADNTAKSLFIGTGEKITAYNEDAVKNLFRGKAGSEGDTYELTCDGTVKQEDDSSAVTLQGIHLTYMRHDGYVTTVSTDIKLKVPQITASAPSIGFPDPNLSEYSCVADKGIIFYDTASKGSTAKSGSFSGSIYAGSVITHENSLTVAANKKIIIGRTRITSEDEAGNVTFSEKRTDGELTVDPSYTGNGGGIILQNNAELWTQDINLQKNSPLTSDSGSQIYVADDLNFEDGGSASINGSYIGFGNGSTSGKSSSILFNSTNKAKLDLSGAENLVLAGRSFIMKGNDTTDSFNGDQIGMGSSITAKGEQRAYLVPSGNGTILGSGITNPQIVDQKDLDKTTARVRKLVEDSSEKKVYGMSQPIGSFFGSGVPVVKVMSFPITGTSKYKQYYYFSFDSVAMANAYFKDYFEANSSEIDKYIRQYADISGLNSAASRTAGTGLSGDTSGKLQVTDADPDTTQMDNEMKGYQDDYKNYSETLDKTSPGSQTPFYHMINVKKLQQTCGVRDTNTAVPVAWWEDKNNVSAVDSNHAASSGNNNLIVVDRLYNKRGSFVLYTYDGSQLTEFKNLKTDNGTIRTTPGASDNGCYVLMQDAARNITWTTYEYNGGSGNLNSAQRQSIIGICNVSDKSAITSGQVGGKEAGYVVWGDFDSAAAHNFRSGDQDINFLIVDGNVRLEHNFHGLIMCSGTMEAVGDLVSDEGIGATALKQTHIWNLDNGADQADSSEDWTLGKMVVYENWKKN